MGFLGVYKAIYDYAPNAEGELSISDGDLLFVIEKNTEDDWWKAKKRASEGEDDEPIGLIPNNYIEEAQPIHSAKALYDYTRQTDEELSFSEDALLEVYDVRDPDWTLIGLNGDYGFAPANYIEIQGEGEGKPRATRTASISSSRLDTNDAPPTPSSTSTPIHTPAAALAGILAQQRSSTRAHREAPPSTPPEEDSPSLPQRPTFTPEASDEDVAEPPAPHLPTRPVSQPTSPVKRSETSARSPPISGPVASPPFNRATHFDEDDETVSPVRGGYHLYNINEIVAVMGKQKKVPTTIGINSANGTIMISPAKSRDGEQQEWSADKLVHYSQEGKHVFMELVKPAKSVDFHAGAKDTAQEIVSALGEIAGAVKAEGLREVIAAGKGGGQKKGRMLYDFVAQGDDEVTVGDGDEVVILDDLKSDEWWMVRRLKNGSEGVVPSSYVEITGTISRPTAPTGLNAGKSTVEQNRLEEERLAREASKASRARARAESSIEVGPGVKLPKRGSSLMVRDNGNGDSSQRKREGKTEPRSPTSSKPKPDAVKTRTWTDRSGTFNVEAEFLGCRDGKIHLHKLNGVKIAVPVVKMSKEDLEYVEMMTGVSLDEDKPLSDIRRAKSRAGGTKSTNGEASRSKAGATVEPKKDEYDWFDFFLRCGVGVHECERYSRNFSRDSMDEGILPDISASNLRTLGLKEGDILRVMRFLDKKYDRSAASRSKRNVSFGGAEVIGNGEGEEESQGGLFSGPGGALRNNTRKGRPAPAVETIDAVDPKAFGRDGSGKSDAKETPLAKVPPPIEKDIGGFDDDAWDLKPSKQVKEAPPSEATSPPPAPITQTKPSGALADLSLLDAPLQPTIAHSTGNQPSTSAPTPQNLSLPQTQTQSQPQQTQLPQMPGANPSFFSQLSQQPTGVQPQNQNAPQGPPLPTIIAQPTGQFQAGFQQQQQLAQRQRPQPPPLVQGQSTLMPPPPPRPLSAPQNVSQPNAFGPPPLQPQLTGYHNPSQFQSMPQTQVAPPGQSLQETNQIRYQQQQISPQMTGYGQPNGMASQHAPFGPQSILPQQTGFNSQQLQPSQSFNSQPGSSTPFANPSQQGPFQSIAPQPTGYLNPQPTGYLNSQQTGYQIQPSTGINSVLPPALLPQATGQNGFGQGFIQQQQQLQPPILSIPQQQTIAPLVPQKTGPPPPVRFGVANTAQKLAPQPTGRRANLSHATPENPFGF
ncbi:MAG: cytoskeletal protein binding protein [Vezdaea aestivalis]|nr:MAG: cytoskeletal protein binding protein [Vezdaea aestivalis]